MTAYDPSLGRRFEIGRVIERTFGVLGAKLGQFLILGMLLVALPSIVLELAVGMTQTAAAGADPFAGFSPLQILISMVGAVVTIALAYLMQAAVVHASVEDLKGRNASLGESIAASARHVLPLIVMAILSGLGIVAGLLLLLVPGVILAIMWSVIVPARVVEERGIIESFRRSAELTRGSRLSLFLLFLVCGVIYFVFLMILTGVAAAVGFGAGGGDMTVAVIGTKIVSIIISTITSVVSSVGVAAIYFELRGRKEGVSREDLATIFS